MISDDIKVQICNASHLLCTQNVKFNKCLKQCSGLVVTSYTENQFSGDVEKKMGSQMKKYNNFKANIITDLPADLKGNLVIVKNI